MQRLVGEEMLKSERCRGPHQANEAVPVSQSEHTRYCYGNGSGNRVQYGSSATAFMECPRVTKRAVEETSTIG